VIQRSIVCLVLIVAASAALAHKPSDSYLTLLVHEATIEGQWDIALRDLDYAIGLDMNGDGAITWGELRARHPAIAAYALAHLQIAAGDRTCLLQAREHLVDHHTDGAYAVLRFTAICPREMRNLTVGYRLLFDLDPQHRGLLNISYQGQTHTAIFSPDHSVQPIELAALTPWREFLAYGREGVWHIWIGYDHILFLLSLLLPAVLKREAHRWQAVTGFHPALVEVVKIVTAFTVAHSITLSLAVFGIFTLPSRWVESAIATSVILAALNNLYPIFLSERRWMVAFAFGLVHGLGFANVLTDLGLPQGALLVALVGFNLGVEVGQLAIVGVFLPLAYRIRHSWLYQRLTLQLGSLLIVILAAIWLVERGSDLRVLG
jgi:hypothetical protein